MATKQGRPVRPSAPALQQGDVWFLTNGEPFVVPPEVHRLDEFRRWARREDFPRNVRVFFNQGALWFDMSNEEIQTHNKVKVAIARVISGLIEDADLGEFYGDGVLVTNEEAGVSNNPDALFVRWESFDANRVRLVAREGQPEQFVEVEGTPDWVLEIVSRSSVQKDTRELLQAYHRAGIPEYWLIDARGEEIDFRIFQHRRSRYVRTSQNEGWQWSNVFQRWARLDRRRGRRDLWRCSLHLREP